MARIHISRRAALDLDDIDRHSIKKWGVTVADRYIQSIETALQTLADNPDLRSLNVKVSQNFYLYRAREHYLVCSYKNNDIVVLTIKSGSLDIPSQLSKLEPTLLTEAEFLHRQF
ncbi:MAG: type II toxin-antitoxin system RelE/ParE family toxin [Kangiellaceae bacterium]|nr:type II toxin-antitoxin system RelE/ParE family toxin [Kangiellaceae bacterium]